MNGEIVFVKAFYFANGKKVYTLVGNVHVFGLLVKFNDKFYLIKN